MYNVFIIRTINSGKSKLNEDQARVHYAHIRVEIPIENGNASEMNGQKEQNGSGLPRKEILIPYYFFALFDGHAGAGAAGWSCSYCIMEYLDIY